MLALVLDSQGDSDRTPIPMFRGRWRQISEDAAEFNGAESQNVEEKPEVMLAEERGQRETRTEIDHQVGACSN